MVSVSPDVDREGRRTIDEYGSDGFPSAEIERVMASLGKSLVFDEGIIEGLVDMRYGDTGVVPLLSILYGHVHTGQAFHVDHIFPRAKLTPQRLRDGGYNEPDVNEIVQLCRDGLANLQILEGGENIGKSDRLPLEWAKQQFPPLDALAGYLARNDMDDVPETIIGFLGFYRARRERIVQRLLAVLGRPPGSLEEHESSTDASLSPSEDLSETV
jgi:hypothetical protein